MTVPSWYVLVVLALAAFRLTRLIGWDDFPPIRRIRWLLLKTTVDRTMTSTAAAENGRYRHGRPTLAAFVECPYCLGFWIALAAYLFWQVWPDGTMIVLFPFALSTLVGTWGRILDP